MNNQDPSHLKEYYRNHDKVKRLWCRQSEFSDLAFFATKLYPTGHDRTEESASAVFFIDYICTFLVQKPSDFLYVFSRFDSEAASKFMHIYCMNDLADPVIIEELLKDPHLICTIGNTNEWIDLPIRRRAARLLSLNKRFDYEDLLPSDLDIPSSTIEYILSWAFEESRLSEQGIVRFKDICPKKFQMLTNLFENRG